MSRDQSTTLLFLLVVLQGGCGEGLEPYNLLEGLRVLAVQAEPPTLAQGESTTLSALVYQEPGRTQSPTYKWSWCPFVDWEDEFACRVSEAEFATLIGLDASTISFDLGTNETASFTYALTEETVTSLCFPETEEVAELFPECDGSLVIYMRLEVSDEQESLSVVKRVRLMTEISEPNQNPSLGEVKAAETDEDKWEDVDEEDASVLATDGTRIFSYQHHYKIFADIPEEASETFTAWAITEAGELVLEQAEESLFLTWFVTAGEAPQTTGRDPPLSDWEVLKENLWTMPADDEVEGNEAQVFLVLHDERGGVSWTERTVRLEFE